MKLSRKLLKELLIRAAILAVLGAALFIYFPGRQTPLALTMATGIGIKGLQTRIDLLQEKAIHKQTFSREDKQFLASLYTCIIKGMRLVLVLPQSSKIAGHYLAGTGEDLSTGSRIFIKSRPVQQEMQRLRDLILADAGRGRMQKEYVTDTFYMGDEDFLDSMMGLYYGRLKARPEKTSGGSIKLAWRAEVPWVWPSYDFMRSEYGDYHAQVVDLPNIRSLFQGQAYYLHVDDGLGEYLSRLGMAKPFLLYAEWEEEIAIAP